ncbi:MAG TPA: ABC transporter permease [Anaerolineales bacterium]|nr:ABC transporter permease [Anaerolineales bacterium]
MTKIFPEILKRVVRLLLPLLLSLLAGALLVLAAGKDPVLAYTRLFEAGFGCDPGPGRCALVTAFQFATPLILTGLSVTVALRSGFFSLGQPGQMLFGAAAASWLAGTLSLPGVTDSAVALLGAALLGSAWVWIPALLKHFIGVNEIIVTILFNQIAFVLVGLFRLPRVEVSARLLPLLPGTKLSAGVFVALLAALLIYLFIWRSVRGLEIRTHADAPRFGRYGGMPLHGPTLIGILLSGALAGLAGGVEVLGVHYHFVSTFSAVNDFDGLIIAFAGQLHPIGVILYAFLLGGLRTGSLVGLQISSGIPRELGSALIALMLLFAATIRFTRGKGDRRQKVYYF